MWQPAAGGQQMPSCWGHGLEGQIGLIRPYPPPTPSLAAVGGVGGVGVGRLGPQWLPLGWQVWWA